MIQYLQIKAHKASKNKFIVFRERNKKFDKKVKETYIPKKKCLAIYGMQASGKTKEIKKVWEARKKIWSRDIFITLSAGDSLSEWFHKNLKETDKNKYTEENYEEFEEQGINIDKEINKQYIKLHMLTNKSRNAIVFIDDIDNLTGKKLEVAKDILRECKQFVITAEDEINIDKTLRNIINKKETKEINLATDVSYDATNILIAVFILTLFVTGQQELAMLVMVARYMTKGKGK